MYEFPENDTDVSKHVGQLKDLNLTIYVTCALNWFCKLIFVINTYINAQHDICRISLSIFMLA